MKIQNLYLQWLKQRIPIATYFLELSNCWGSNEHYTWERLMRGLVPAQTQTFHFWPGMVLPLDAMRFKGATRTTKWQHEMHIFIDLWLKYLTELWALKQSEDHQLVVLYEGIKESRSYWWPIIIIIFNPLPHFFSNVYTMLELRVTATKLHSFMIICT